MNPQALIPEGHGDKDEGSGLTDRAWAARRRRFTGGAGCGFRHRSGAEDPSRRLLSGRHAYAGRRHLDGIPGG